MTRRPRSGHDGTALQTVLLLAAAVTLAVLIALALTQWFGRLS